jgi:hypothetical protein
VSVRRVRLTRVAWLAVRYAWWRATGSTSAGRRVVDTLGRTDEGLRTIAAMLLVKAGPRAEPLVREALHRRESLPLVLGVLGDIGGLDAGRELAPFVDDADPGVARAARDALRVLHVRHARPASP